MGYAYCILVAYCIIMLIANFGLFITNEMSRSLSNVRLTEYTNHDIITLPMLVLSAISDLLVHIFKYLTQWSRHGGPWTVDS